MSQGSQRNMKMSPYPVNVAWQTEFPLPEKKGHLLVSLKQAIRAEDKVPLFVLELTARGFDESSGKGSSRKWFDMAHELRAGEEYLSVDPSHSGIYNLKQDDELIAELILETIRETYPARI